TMEGDAPAHPANRAALRAGRPDLPPATAAGAAPMGVRQPQNLTAPRSRDRRHDAAAAGRRSRRPQPTQARHRTTKAAGRTRRLSIAGLPPAALIAGRIARLAPSSKILTSLRKHLVFLDK